MASTQSSMGTIDSFLKAVGRVKAAEAHTEPGSIGGATEHPVKDVDDRTEVAKEGERSKENETDVKEDQGKVGVNSVPDAKAAADAGRKRHLWTPTRIASQFAKTAEGGAVQTPGSAHDDHLNIGTNAQPTGEDKSNETSSAKKGKEDPGSSHPARTDNDSLDGHKYSHDATGLAKLANDLGELGDSLCSQLAWLTHDPKQADDANGHVRPQTNKQADDSQAAYQAGYELAGLLTGQMDKAAADRLVKDTIAQIIKTASDDADRLAYFYQQRDATIADMQKQANMPMDPAAMGGAMGGGMPVDPAAMGGGGGEEMPPEEDPAAMGGGGGGDEEALMAALGGGEPAGGEEEGGDAELAALLAQLAESGELGDIGGGGEEVPAEEPKVAADKAGVAKAPSPEVQKAAKDYLKELVKRSRR